MTDQPNPILHNFRPGFKSCQFKTSSQFRARPFRAGLAMVDLHSQPSNTAPIDTQLLPGESISVFAIENGWAWVQSEHDHYQGYCQLNELQDSNQTKTQPTHKVIVPRTFVYSKPDLKAQSTYVLPMNAHIYVQDWVDTKNGRYALLSDGQGVFAKHLAPLDVFQNDFVKFAEQLLHTPYLWAGRSGCGLDCSALVQLSLNMCGIKALRDTDMQEATLGNYLPKSTLPEDFIRGDLIFWKGHVGIIAGPNTLLHANAYSMDVTLEPFKKAVERIASLYQEPSSYKRLKL